MFKKIILSTVILSFSSGLFAANSGTTITVAHDPSGWGYMNGYVSIIHQNHQQWHLINGGGTWPVSIGDVVSLQITAVNSGPKNDVSCNDIQINEDGSHQLIFKLENDHLIHCRYS
jgi:hypothetical protein